MSDKLDKMRKKGQLRKQNNPKLHKAADVINEYINYKMSPKCPRQMGGKISNHQNCDEFKQMGVALGQMALSQRSVSSCQSPRPWAGV